MAILAYPMPLHQMAMAEMISFAPLQIMATLLKMCTFSTAGASWYIQACKMAGTAHLVVRQQRQAPIFTP